MNLETNVSQITDAHLDRMLERERSRQVKAGIVAAEGGLELNQTVIAVLAEKVRRDSGRYLPQDAQVACFSFQPSRCDCDDVNCQSSDGVTLTSFLDEQGRRHLVQRQLFISVPAVDELFDEATYSVISDSHEGQLQLHR